MSTEEFRVEDTLGISLVVAVMHGIIGLIFVFLLNQLNFLGDAGRAIDQVGWMLIAAIFPIQSIQFMLGPVLQGLGNFSKSNHVLIVRAISQPLLVVGLVVIGDLGLNGAIAAYLLSLAASVLIGIYGLPKLRFELNVGLQFLKLAYRFGLKSWPGTLFTKFNLRLDQLLLAPVVAPGVLGNYYLAVRFSEMPWLLPDGVGPVLAKYIAVERNSDPRLVTEKLHRLMFWTSAAACIAGALIIQPIALFLGQEYSQVAPICAGLFIGTLFFVTSKVLSKHFLATGRPGITGLVGVVGGVAALISYAILIPLYGVGGAVVATVFSYGIRTMMAVYMYVRICQGNLVNLFKFSARDFIWAYRLLFKVIRRFV